MRAAAARASSSMHALVGVAAAAGSGSSAAGLSSTSHSSRSSSSSSSSAARSGLPQQPRRAATHASSCWARFGWSHGGSINAGPLGLPHSDVARQRRLVAASPAAEPALAVDSWESRYSPLQQCPPAFQQGGIVMQQQQQPGHQPEQLNGTQRGDHATAEAAGPAGTLLPDELPPFRTVAPPATPPQAASHPAAPAASGFALNSGLTRTTPNSSS